MIGDLISGIDMEIISPTGAICTILHKEPPISRESKYTGKFTFLSMRNKQAKKIKQFMKEERTNVNYR